MMISVLAISLFMLVSYSEAGVSFVRWGRTSCPTGTVRLYKGYMGGGHHNAGGEGSNYVCINEDPKFVRPAPGRQDWTGYIWGTEFEIVAGEAALFKTDNIPGGALHNQDAPCVLCYVQDSTDKFVMYGRPDCGDSGYDLQYSGFLVSQANADRRRSEYVCVDEAPEGRVGGSGNDNQAVAYPVQIGCGSLPCNPFVDGYELTCALCTY